jgi:hypothetical protein
MNKHIIDGVYLSIANGYATGDELMTKNYHKFITA